jgi:Lrp/AsnC family transcriptional regulator
MDRIDRKILALLQDDASLPVAQIAERVGISQTPCWRRIQRLEADGTIVKRVALLNPRKLNVDVTVFVLIKTSHHDRAWFERFKSLVLKIPEVVEFHRLSGHTDYLLRVVVSDIAGYDAVYQQLIHDTQLFDVSSSFAMETIKLTTALPLDHVGERRSA